MVTIGIFLLACFVLIPLPVCFFLLVQRRRMSERIDELEGRIGRSEKSVPPSSVEEIPTIRDETPIVEETPSEMVFEAKVEEVEVEDELDDVSPEPLQPEKPKKSLTEFLRSIGCLPPEDIKGKEAGIIQWWAPRIGGLLAVLTAIFFSVYISKNTSPFVRFLELLAGDAAVIGLGAYFWNRRRRFGSILLSVGLSMLYVTAIAGYAASPVRVFTNPIIGMGVQFAIVALIYVVSVRLKERGIAFLATLFGFASSIFSAYVGLNEGALLSALALQIVGVSFGHRWRFAALVSISTIGVYLPVISFCGLAVINSQTFTVPYLLSVISFLAIAVSSFPFLALRTNARQLFSGSNWRLLSIANTSLCGAIGYAYVKLVGGDLLWLYGTLAIVFLFWSLLFSKTGLRTLLFQLFFLKGCGLAALWLANYFSGEFRWFAIVIECVLVAWSVRQSKSIWSEAATFLLWIAAAYIASATLQLVAWSVPWLLYVAFPILSVTAAAFQLSVLETTKTRKVLYGAFGLANGIIAFLVIYNSNIGETQLAIYLACFATVFAALSQVRLFSKLPFILATIPPLLASHVAFWGAPESIVAFLVLLGITLAFAYAVAIGSGNAKSKKRKLPEFLLLALASIAIYAYLFSAYSSEFWFPYFAPVFAIFLKATRIHPFKTLSNAYLLPILLDLTFHVHEEQAIGIRIVCLVLYSLLLSTPFFRPQWERNIYFMRSKGFARKAAHILVALFFIASAANVKPWLESNLIQLSGAVVFFVLWRLHRHRIALVLSMLFVGLSLFSVSSQYFGYRSISPWSWQILLLGGSLAATALAFGCVLSNLPSRRLSQTTIKVLAYGLAIVSYVSIALSLAYPGLSLDSYYTPMIATYGLVLIGIGIAAKIKPYRIVALASFILPIGRLFIFDIQETLHRIIAFAALAALLTIIGYLYNRFASRIE